jgi:hypothetical protein
VKTTNRLKQRAVTNFLFAEREKPECILEGQFKMCGEDPVDLHFGVAKTDKRGLNRSRDS